MGSLKWKEAWPAWFVMVRCACHGNPALGVRLREIHALIESLVEEFFPDAVAVESVFTALNMRTAIQLAEVRGVVLLAAAQASIPSHSYSPREVKACVAGYGAASKDQVQQMVRATLGLRERPEPADASDALAVALCHAFLSRSRERLAATAPLPRARRTARAWIAHSKFTEPPGVPSASKNCNETPVCPLYGYCASVPL